MCKGALIRRTVKRKLVLDAAPGERIPWSARLRHKRWRDGQKAPPPMKAEMSG